jgi:hypothetical protein
MTVVGGADMTAVVRVPRRVVREADPATRDLALVAMVAIPFALRFPIATSIGSLVAFGLAHTFLELRWVLSRFRTVLSGGFLALLFVPATTIALSRLAGGAKAIEIVAGFAVVALALGQGVRIGRIRPAPAAVGAAALTLGLVLSLRTPGMYGVVLAHLHNTVTGVLLWEWSTDRRFRTGLIVLFAAVPALVLAGGADMLLPGSLAAGATGPAHMLVAGVAPPAWAATTLGIRLVAVFAFLQVVHYGVWCWLLPKRQRQAGSTAPTAPTASATRAGWIAAAGVATAVLALVFRTDYATGRTLYGSLATYHAYLELPVVVFLLGGSRVPR